MSRCWPPKGCVRWSRSASASDEEPEVAAAYRQIAATWVEQGPIEPLLDTVAHICLGEVDAIGLTTAALAEALKVAHINLDDKEAVAGLSLLSTLGMICADATTFLVPVPRPLLLRIARYLDAAATSIADGANLPDGLDETNRRHFADILAHDADGIRALANTDIPALWRSPNPHRPMI